MNTEQCISDQTPAIIKRTRKSRISRLAVNLGFSESLKTYHCNISKTVAVGDLKKGKKWYIKRWKSIFKSLLQSSQKCINCLVFIYYLWLSLFLYGNPSEKLCLFVSKLTNVVLNMLAIQKQKGWVKGCDQNGLLLWFYYWAKIYCIISVYYMLVKNWFIWSSLFIYCYFIDWFIFIYILIDCRLIILLRRFVWHFIIIFNLY